MTLVEIYTQEFEKRKITYLTNRDKEIKLTVLFKRTFDFLHQEFKKRNLEQKVERKNFKNYITL